LPGRWLYGYDDITPKKGFEGDYGAEWLCRNHTPTCSICKDEKVAGLLDVVESFKEKYYQTRVKRSLPPGSSAH
jgi:DNA polymerase-3 subunit gamma/tau